MNTGGPNLKKPKKKIKKRLLFIIPAGFGWGIGRVQKKKKMEQLVIVIIY